jgi:hypothetical protein
MAKITRFSGNLPAFGSLSTGTNRTVFGDVTQSDTLDDNINADFQLGWEITGVNDAPSKQDFNALGFTHGQLLAYLHQAGVAEYDAAQEYFVGSVVNFQGQIYKSIAATNIGNTPSALSTNWMILSGVIQGQGYSDITSLDVSTIYDGQEMSLTDPDIWGGFKLVNSVAHGITTTIGVQIRINDDWYAQRTYNGTIVLSWFIVPAEANHSVALQAAIDYAESLNYGSIYAPTRVGGYNLGTAVTISTPIRIYGDGFIPAATSYGTVFNTTLTTGTVIELVNAGGSYDTGLILEDFLIKGPASGTATGLKVSGGVWNNTRIHNITVREMGGIGLHIDDCLTASVTECRAQANGSHGFYIQGSNGLRLTGCMSESNSGRGYYFEATAASRGG